MDRGAVTDTHHHEKENPAMSEETEETSGGIHPLDDGSETVEAQLPEGFEIPADSEVKVEAVSPQGRSLWIPLPWIPVPTQPPPPPVTTTRPPVTTTPPPVTTTPPPVTTTPPPLTATIAERTPQSGAPGSQVIASVLVTNTGATRIGVQNVVLTAPAGTRLANGYLGTWRDSEGDLSYPGTLAPGGNTSTCSGVPVNLDPGEWVVFYTAVIIDPGAAPGPAPVTFAIGSPAFATGTGGVIVA
ncbi:hypothetical protein ACFY1P_32170 [Streptomyces sp. NPDC001407]|uniref:hypothetical protein n=1 Tax=unclassified Streptomyces TaxID=2593676 RepID=UPI00340BCB5A